MGMVQTGEDSGFVQVRLDILGLGDSFGSGHFDGDRAVEIVIIGQEDLTEPALAQASEDRVTPDLPGMEKREGFLRISFTEAAQVLSGRRIFGFVHRLNPQDDRSPIHSQSAAIVTS